MSLEAIGWALRDAQGVPAQCVSVLVGLAEHADRDGRHAYPAVSTLAAYARKSVRQVQYDLERLIACGLIKPGDQSLTGRFPLNRRPVVYDLAMNDIAVQWTAPQEPQLGVQSASALQSTAPQQPIAPHGELSVSDLQEHHGVQFTAPHAAPTLGCNAVRVGVQSTADKPSSNQNLKSKPSSRRRSNLNDGREDAMRLCTHLADRIEANGSKRPSITKAWLTDARLLIDADGRTEAQVHRAIDWCQSSPFWRKNVMSMPKLREKYDRLRMDAEDERNGVTQRTPGQPAGSRPSTTDQRAADAQALKAKFRQQAAEPLPPNTIQGSVIK